MMERLADALMYGARLSMSRALGRSPFSKSVILAGSGRSGTTWVGNIINHDDDYRVAFEPVHRENVPEFSHFASRQYLRAQNADPAYLEPVKRLLEGRIRNKWIDSRNRNEFARKLLIKDIRTNLLLAWIAHRFPAVRIVLLLRHPYAIAASRIKLGWPPFRDTFLAQADLMEDFLDPFRELLSEPHNDFSANVICWCVENYVPLKQFATGGIHVCCYERFILDPESEVRRLVEFLGDPFPRDLDTVLARTSDTDWNRRGPQPAFDEWRREVTAADRDRGNAILARFGMDGFYDDGGYPLTPSIR